jgi:hypothetical protein
MNGAPVTDERHNEQHNCDNQQTRGLHRVDVVTSVMVIDTGNVLSGPRHALIVALKESIRTELWSL